jgi:hypothetical protein
VVQEGAVKKVVLLVALVAGLSGAAGAGPAQAANECNGLMVCVPVRGPWVAVPVRNTIPRPRVEWQLTCPTGYVVGGLDARLSVPGIDITFIGSLGSPVNPGISTGRTAVFVASYVGATARAPSFKPYAGCIPSSGGGRIPTAVRVVRPGKPTTRRVKTSPVKPGVTTVTSACRGGEVLVDASNAFGFSTGQPPSESLIRSVTGRRSIRGNRVVVSARGDAELGRVNAAAQVHAVCSVVR